MAITICRTKISFIVIFFFISFFPDFSFTCSYVIITVFPCFANYRNTGRAYRPRLPCVSRLPPCPSFPQRIFPSPAGLGTLQRPSKNAGTKIASCAILVPLRFWQSENVPAQGTQARRGGKNTLREGRTGRKA